MCLYNLSLTFADGNFGQAPGGEGLLGYFKTFRVPTPPTSHLSFLTALLAKFVCCEVFEFLFVT